MQNIVKKCDDSRSEAEATAKVSGTTPHKKRFAEIYSDDYLERLRNLRNLRIKNPYLTTFFRFPTIDPAAWVCTAECYLLSVLKPIGLCGGVTCWGLTERAAIA